MNDEGVFRVTTTDHPGIGLRDWFAGQALIALSISDRASVSDQSRDSGTELADVYAVWAYEQADAMIAERERTSHEPNP